MLRTVNRVLLGLVGLSLIGTGLAALTAALDLPRRWSFGPPSGWSWRGPTDVPLTQGDRTQWAGEAWWWPVVIAGLTMLLLLALWWLFAQLRRHRLDEVALDSGDGAGALLRGRAVEDVVAAEAESLPGVDRARVTLTGRRHQPRARVGLSLDPEAHPRDTVRALRTGALEHARTSAGLAGLPTEVRLRAARHRPERVS